MPAKRVVIIFLAGMSSALIATAVHAAADDRGATGLVREVREATADFRDPAAAFAAGYASLGSCVSGPQQPS
jgi:cellobiose-specific phosphotransferase system component IIB